MIPVYMTSMPPGTIPKIWLRDDLDLTQFKRRPRERIITHTSREGTWEHRALLLAEEELSWDCPIHPQWEAVIPEFWRRFHALVRERYRRATPDGGYLRLCPVAHPAHPHRFHPGAQREGPHRHRLRGLRPMGWGRVSATSGETGEVDIKTLPEFAGSYTAQTDLKVPFTWTPAEMLDRYDVVYTGEIAP